MILGVNGRPAAEEHVVDFLRFAVYRGIDLNDIWIATDASPGGQIPWAVLPVVSPGRTMLLFSPSFIPLGDRQRGAVELVRRILDRHRAAGTVDLAQVLLDPADESVTQLYRDACGFEELAELIYLDRDVHRAPPQAPPAGFSWETYSPANHADFARAVTETYAGSLDCPRLNGRRDIEDVLAGHKSAGEFDPALWFLLRENGEHAGVLLMSRSTRSDSVELVYLGLSPRHRGRKLGDLVMRHACSTAAAAVGARRLSLAVDANNTPALRLYRRHGMSRLCSRLALLRDLRGG
jgi:ribosomal protein S18 acetylase RimI-like enzyme